MDYDSLEEVMYCLEVATESSLSVDDYRQRHQNCYQAVL